MKTIYVYNLDYDDPIEDYVPEEYSDAEIQEYLHKKYGKQGWVTFSFEKK